MDQWTPLAAIVISTILLPVIGVLWYTKADDKAINEALGGLEKDNDHLREWLATHEASDERMFKELRDGHAAISKQLADNFQTLIMEIRRAGNGRK